MTWRYRRAGGWQAPTIKARKNRRWVKIDGDNDDSRETDPSNIPKRFYTDGPPERSGNTITYPADGHSSIEDAVYDLSSGDTLYIEPGRYEEQIFIDETVASNITIESDLKLAFDSDHQATVAQSGAVIQMPNEDYGIEFKDHWLNNDGTFYGTYNDPDDHWDWGSDSATFPDTIEVDTTSPFEIGDVIMIEEQRAPYGLSGGSGGANHSENTVELRVIESFPSSTEIELDVPLFMPYPDEASRRIGLMDWTIEDVVLRGLEIEGTGEDPDVSDRPLELFNIRDGWFENLYLHSAGENPFIRNERTFNMRFNRLMFEDSHKYGLSTSTVATRTLVTDVYSNNIRRYTTNWGGGARNSSDGYATRIHGSNMKTRAAVDVHHGGFHITFRDIRADNAVVSTLRSKHILLENFEATGDAPPGEFLINRQRPVNVVYRNGHIHSVTDSSDSVFSFGLRDENASSNSTMPEYFDRLVFENIEIDDYGPDITDIGEFEGDQTGDSLTFRNVIYGGQQLTKSDVQQWDGYDNVTINNLTVE